ncbi:hypothetical protein MASR1M32_15560 [Rhodobacter sp.]
MTTSPTRSRDLGWILAGVSSAAILSGAAALAIAAEQRPEAAPMILDLTMLPSSAPNVAAVAEDAPEVMDQVTQQFEPPEMEPPPELETDTAPDLPVQTAMSLPQIDKPVVADLALPPPPEEPKEDVKEVRKAEKPPEKKKEKPPEKKKAEKKKEPVKKAEKAEKPKEDSAQPAAKAGATAEKSGKAKGGSNVSPKAYQNSVFKKVKRRFKASKGKGTTVVSFTISASGGLAGVQVAQSSGNAAIDKAAVDAVRRAGNFGPPPDGKSVTYSIQMGVQ